MSKPKPKVLIIGDLHAPFDLPGYFSFCKKVYKEYSCNQVIFIGDLLDIHAVSRHPANPDGYSPGYELYEAIEHLQPYYRTWPNAIVTMGNHDYRINKRAFTSGLSERMIKPFNEIIQAPRGWKFVDQYVKDNVCYVHGSVGNAFTRAKESRMSIVSGHLHSFSAIQYSTSFKDTIWGMNVGAGLDSNSYAAAYAKDLPKKPIINCGLVLNGIPFLIPMNHEK